LEFLGGNNEDEYINQYWINL